MDLENVKQNSSGHYFGKCIHCGCNFIGEKRDFTCDDCKTVQTTMDDYVDEYGKRWIVGLDLARD